MCSVAHPLGGCSSLTRRVSAVSQLTSAVFTWITNSDNTLIHVQYKDPLDEPVEPADLWRSQSVKTTCVLCVTKLLTWWPEVMWWQVSSCTGVFMLRLNDQHIPQVWATTQSQSWYTGRWVQIMWCWKMADESKHGFMVAFMFVYISLLLHVTQILETAVNVWFKRLRHKMQNSFFWRPCGSRVKRVTSDPALTEDQQSYLKHQLNVQFPPQCLKRQPTRPTVPQSVCSRAGMRRGVRWQVSSFRSRCSAPAAAQPLTCSLNNDVNICLKWFMVDNHHNFVL